MNYQDSTDDYLIPDRLIIHNSKPHQFFSKVMRNILTLRSSPIAQDNKWKYINMNPSPPSVSGLIQLH
jgi:hypothetical protein